MRDYSYKHLRKENSPNASNIPNNTGLHHNKSLHEDDGEKRKKLKQKIARNCKSTRRNVLNCEQILELAQKKNTHSSTSLSMHENPTSRIYCNKKQQNHSKPTFKSKQKSNKSIHTKKQTRHSKGKNKIHPTKTIYSKICNFIDLNHYSSNFPINYPLSQSNSLIVFSDKQMSNHSTGRKSKFFILDGQKQKSTISNKNCNLIEMPLKLIKFKLQHAATVIQKHWRGYLTRKILNQYIGLQESQLNKHGKLDQNLMKEIEQAGNRQKEEVIQNFSHIVDQSCQPQQSVIMENSLDHQKRTDEFSLSLYEAKDNSNLPIVCQKNEGSLFKIKNNVCQSKICQTEKQLSIISQLFQQEYHPQKEDGQNFYETLHQKGKSILQHEIEKEKLNSLNKMKTQQINFQCMLEVRNQIKKKGEQIELYLLQFLQEFGSKINDLKNIQKNIGQDKKEEEKNDHQQEEQRDKQRKYQQEKCEEENEVQYEQSKLEGKVQIVEEKLQSFEGEVNEQTQKSSPISEYYFVDLPTEELSPHYKQNLSSGLLCIHDYLLNLYHSYLNQTQTEIIFLCQILKTKSQVGADNMIDRCLLQMLVEIITQQYILGDVIEILKMIGRNQKNNCEEEKFIRKWEEEINKWQMGPIEEVSGNMEESQTVSDSNSSKYICFSPSICL